MDSIAEIKARLSIDQLVGEYCQLQKKGRNFVCLCPFHNDTRPSLHVSPDKGIAYCFACQSGGDVFSFYQKIEGVDFRQALKDLAEKAGVELPREKAFTTGPKKEEKDRLRECLEEAMRFYQSELNANSSVQKYVSDRKTPSELVESFAIGYAPDSFDATYTHLLKKEFSRSEILKAGLGIQKELTEERIYDRFRNRLMFPIRDHQGNLIGFGGRTLGEDASTGLSTSDAKYINSPDGPLYNKSAALFGFSHARDAIRKTKTVILVEGYFDVLAFHRIGVQNVVAVSGTALTEQHVMTIKRNAERIVLCLDNDSAGEEAARRAFMLCKAQDLDVRLLRLPTGKDPDECANTAAEAMRAACASGGIPYIDHIMTSLQETKTEKRAMLDLLLPLLNVIPSSVEREDSVQKAAAMLGASVTALEDDLRREKQSTIRREVEQSRSVQSTFTSVELLLGLFLTYPKHIGVIHELLEPEAEKPRALFHALKAATIGDNPAAVIQALKEDVREYASVLALFCEEHFGTWSQDLSLAEIRKLCLKVNRDDLRKKQQLLLTDIRNARSQGKKMEEEKLLTQYQQVLTLSAKAS